MLGMAVETNNFFLSEFAACFTESRYVCLIDGKCSVMLYKPSDPDISINEKLVRLGLAQWVNEALVVKKTPAQVNSASMSSASANFSSASANLTSAPARNTSGIPPRQRTVRQW